MEEDIEFAIHSAKDELTEEMHKDFYVSPEVEIKLRCGCVWAIIDYNASKEEIEEACELYSVTYEDAMLWKDYWRILDEKTEIKAKKRKMQH